jgi:mRNA interferase MazF
MITIAPDAGDNAWMNFTLQSGKEQDGKRPALVLSPRSYNQKIGLMVVCPITSRSKRYVFEVALPDGLPVKRVIFSDIVMLANWTSRGAKVVASLPADTLRHFRAKIKNF